MQWRKKIALVALMAGGLLVAAPAVATSPPPLTGSLREERGVKVLRLHGDAYHRGYTHGNLLGPEILKLAKGVLLSKVVWGDVQIYEQRVRTQVLPLFKFTPDQQRELEGILQGTRDRVGADGLRLDEVDREFDLTDLMAANVFADIQNGGCTTFAAWGPATKGGEMVVGRNLDFNRLPGLAENQLIIVRTDAADGQKRWVTVGWPGMIGGYTVMNEDGVVASMHDVRAASDLSAGPFVPRALALRAIGETVGASDTVERAAQILRSASAFCGNNFLVAAPFTGQDTPAAVFEYDGERGHDDGVTLRTTADSGHDLPPTAITCTNHYRMRASATPCDRYASVKRLLTEHTGEVDAEFAHQIQSAAAESITLHTVVALPNRREFTVYFCTPDKNATQTEGVRFKLDDLFKE